MASGSPTPLRENIARYIVRASFSQERMTYIAEESKVVYQSKDGKEKKVFVKKIFKHLGLWDVKARPPKATGPPKTPEYSIDYSTCQLPASDNLSRASRSKEWLAEGHVFSVIDPEPACA